MSSSDRGYIVAPTLFVPVAENNDLVAGDLESAWQQRANEPQRQVPFALAAVAPVLFFVAGAVVPLDVPSAGSIEDLTRDHVIVYQQKAEPLLPIEPVLPFDWWVPATEPVREQPRAVDEGGPVWIPEPEDTERDILTRWWQPASEPVRVKPRLVDEGMLARAPPDPALIIEPVGPAGLVTIVYETLTIAQAKAEPIFVPVDDLQEFWLPQPNEPVRTKPRLVDEGFFVRSDLLPPIADRDWFQPTNEPQRQVPRPVDEGGVVRGDDPEPLTPRFDWWRLAEEPVRVPPPLRTEPDALQVEILPIAVVFTPTGPVDVIRPTLPVNEGGLTFVGELPPIADRDWQQPANEPVRELPRLVDEGLHVWNVDDLPTGLDELRPANEPVRELPRLVDEGGLFWVGELPPIADEDWRPATNEPVRLDPRAVDEGGLTFEGELPPIADRDWQQPTNEPVRTKPRLVDEGTHVWNLDDLPTGIVELRPASEPVRTKARLVDEGAHVQNLDPISKFDFDWWHQGNEPQRAVPPLRPDPDATQVEILPAQPVPPFDSWVQPANEPVRELPRLTDEGLHVWNLDDLPTGLVELRPPSEPVRVPPRLVNEGGLVWVGELPPIADFDWWRPAAEPVREVPQPTREPDATQVEILPESAPDFVPPQQPDRFPLPTLVPEGFTVRTPEPPPVADFDWWRAAAEPVRTLARLVDEGLLVRNFDPIPKGDVENAWLRFAEIPVLPAPFPEGLFVQDFVQPVVVPSFDWFRLAEEPVRSVAPLRPQFFVLGDEPRPTGIVELRPAEEPVRVKARLVDEGMVPRDILPAILPFVEGVLRLPAIPVLPIWTGAHLHVPPVQVEELPPFISTVPIFQPLPLLLTFRDCAPIVISSERWPHQFNKFTVDATTGRGEVDALDPFPEPSSGGADDPAIDPREPNLQRRHEWNL